jgi:hypothetical protein
LGICLYYLKKQNIIWEEVKEFLFQQIFRQQSDPRRWGHIRHQLPDMALLVVAAALCGADSRFWSQATTMATQIRGIQAWRPLARCNQQGLLAIGLWAKSSGITAIPSLIALFDIKGCTISVDAMGCQRDIARKIKDKEAEYILAVKGNQSTLEEGIRNTVRFHRSFDYREDIDCGHGRIERRSVLLSIILT